MDSYNAPYCEMQCVFISLSITSFARHRELVYPALRGVPERVARQSFGGAFGFEIKPAQKKANGPFVRHRWEE